MSSTNGKDCDTTRPCSYCKRDVAVVNFMLHELHCMKHIALCPQCKEPAPKSQLADHIAQEHSKVTCALCEKEFERHELEDHKVNNCGQRPVVCQYCEIELPVNKMEEHEDACGSRTEKCVTCQSYIMIKDAEEHKLYDCRHQKKPPEKEQYWDSEEESPNYGYEDEHNGMLPCEFCDRPYPVDFLIQHQSGCDQNAMRGNTRRFHRDYLPDDDLHEDGIRYAVPELNELSINPSNGDRKIRENNLKPENQEDRLPINQSRTVDRASSVQREKPVVEKKRIDESHSTMDSESARNETSTAKESNTSSFDVIPCEFCDSLIELNFIMEHQKMCRWVHPNQAFKEHRFGRSDHHHHAANRDHEYDFDESRPFHPQRFQRGRGYSGPSRGLTHGNTKWSPERNGHSASRSNYSNTEKRSHWEVENDLDTAADTSSYQSRSRGQPGYRNYNQDRGQTYAEGEPPRYKGRTEYQGSRWQHEERHSVRPLMDFESDDVRQRWQREEMRTTRQQHEDNNRSNGQQEQQGKPIVQEQGMNANPRSDALREEPNIPRSRTQEQANKRPEGHNGIEGQRNNDHGYQSQPRQQEVGVANKRPEGHNGTEEQRKDDHGYQLQPRQQEVGVANKRPEGHNGTEEQRKEDHGYQRQQVVGIGQSRTQEAEAEVVSRSTRVLSEEEYWRVKRGTNEQSRGRYPRGRGRPAQNHRVNTRSQRDIEEDERPKEPAAGRRTERTEGEQTQKNLRQEVGQEARPREGDDRGRPRSGRRGRGRGRSNWRQERWNRTKGQADEDYYNAPWPRRSDRDHND